MHTHDPLQPHSHDPNPEPPGQDTSFELILTNGHSHTVSLEILNGLPQTAVSNCLIISTGHGTSGPFTFSGVTLLALVKQFQAKPWISAEVISGDGFGNRVTHDELTQPNISRPILLATQRDGEPLTRQQGAVRLIVPSEADDALRQVKWVATIRLVA